MAPSSFKWLDTSLYPFKPHYFAINGQQMHYIDEGQGEVLLFVHGTPSWSFDFRAVIKALREHYRCIAIDHIGFGLSDKPESYDYSTQNHSKTLEIFVKQLQIDNITLILHDFGGPIGLNFAIHHSALIKKLVILNSWLWSGENDPQYIKLSKILRSPLLPFLYRQLNFSPRFILPRSFGDKRPTPKVLKHYTQPFANAKQRNGALAFAHSLLHDQPWFERLWGQKESIAHKPVLLIWGMKDQLLVPAYLEKFQQGFQHSTVVKLDTCGHFPQEEEPEKVSEAITHFLHQ